MSLWPGTDPAPCGDGVDWTAAAELLGQAVDALSRVGPPAEGACVILSYSPFEGPVLYPGEDWTWEARAYRAAGRVIEEVGAASPEAVLRELLAVPELATPAMSSPQGQQGQAVERDAVNGSCGLEGHRQLEQVGALLQQLAALTDRLPPEDGNFALAIAWDGGEGAPRPGGWVWDVEVWTGDFPADPDALVWVRDQSAVVALTDAVEHTRRAVGDSPPP